MSEPVRKKILYCHCAYAKVVPEDVKRDVLRKLGDSEVAFDAVPDLCEMSARKDPALSGLAAAGGELRIAACYPRAVRWLFHAAGAALPPGARIHNMRERTAGEVIAGLLEEVAEVEP